METNNWIFTAYNKKNEVVESFEIKDRTEHEADNEAMRFVETHQHLKIDDWTLTKNK